MLKISLNVMVAVGLVAVAGSAFARADCEAHPKSEWIKQSDFKKKLEDDGYVIRKFKVDDNCYEIYGKNKEGKKVEIYFDTKTGAPVKSNIEN